ncbi:MAG: response regulator [Oscillospiraceae bacterium]|nr:response regulator [Oscillospiraceae bacterium]
MSNENVSTDPPKIIMVDDVSFTLISVRERLKSKYEIYPAQSAESLFELLDNITPDLILLDINMPEVDGYETIKRLKEDPSFSHIPVVFLTARNDKNSIKKGMKLGAVDFVIKPFTDAELMECIDYHLSPGNQDSVKPVVLAVDDNQSILQSVNAMLEDMCKVYTLPEPEKLQTLMQHITPDLFILDCNMPVLNGFELVPIIRAIPEHEETPIMFLTSDGTPDNVYVATHLGASGFIVKPIDKELLRSRVGTALADFMIRRRVRTSV